MPRRELTSHKINGANGDLDVHVMDDPGPGGACRHYRATFANVPGGPDAEVFSGYLSLVFQSGDPAVVGTNGLTHEALLAVLIDRLQGFQAGTFACRENAIALTKLQEALMWLKSRTEARLARGVEGTLTP
ncbi:DUF7681 family protein [Singulisphaera sp. PoT]|uniref:Acb2/Tad1 domain-containing protein n=1 Tax=Singulisphaera sp. PoT TaxID=3411797 RepID=UPI003BF51551